MGKLIPNAFNFWVVVFVALGSTACSYGMSVISSTIGQPSFYKSFNLATTGEPGYAHTSNLIGAMNGLNSAGSAFGCWFTAWSADKYGRKMSIQIGAFIMLIGAALCSGSVNVAMFLVARFIAGFGIGILVTAIPMYQAEVSTPESRGFMVSMHGVMFAVGYSLSAWIGFGCYFISASGSSSSFPWRFPLAFQGAPALLLLIGSPWLPKSPRWLFQQDRPDEAWEVLRKLHHTTIGDDTVSKKEFYQMQKQLDSDRKIKRGKWEIFATAPNRKRSMIGFGLMFGNQFTGVLVIANYGVLLYTSLGMKKFMPLLLSALWVTSTFPGNIFTSLMIDRLGRRTFMLIGLAGTMVANILEAALQAEYLGTTNAAGQKAAIFAIFLFILFWSSFLDASQFLYLSEIFPMHIRAEGMALGMSALYLADIIVLVAGPIALDKIKWKFFLVFIIPTAVEWLCVFFFFPETKQRSLEDINAAFGEDVAVHYYGATTEEQEEYLKAIAAGDIVHHDHKGGLATDSGDEKTSAQVLHTENVRKIGN